jgi:2-dehydropantoate 2-reductase
MRIVVIGAGALGGQFSAHLSRAGADLSIVDTDTEHVAAIAHGGLRVGGAFGDHTVRVPVFSSAEAAAAAAGPYDAAFVHVDSNNTAAAGEAAASLLTPEGFVLQIQNGLGNVEVLEAAVGPGRVVGGSTMCSAASAGPGRPLLTHHGPTSFGEPRGGLSPVG